MRHMNRMSTILMLLGALAVVVAVAPPSVRGDDGSALVHPGAVVDSLTAPAIGATAPDFTAPSVGASGTEAAVSLSALRGHVIVVAFYPKDRTGGCTAELSKFRDDFATIFGDGVTVLPVSLDDVASHKSWAAEMRFPFALVSDSGGVIARRYGSIDEGKPYANRTVFVIGKDGRVVHRELRFGALNQHAYDELAAAVARAKRG